MTSLNDTSFYYYMLISKNDVTLNDNLLFGSTVTKSFIETRIDYKVSQELPAVDSYLNAFISIYI